MLERRSSSPIRVTRRIATSRLNNRLAVVHHSHSREFVYQKFSVVELKAPLPKQHRPVAVNLDRSRRHQKNRRKQYRSDDGQDKIKRAFHQTLPTIQGQALNLHHGRGSRPPLLWRREFLIVESGRSLTDTARRAAKRPLPLKALPEPKG